ncbi:MAG: ATP-binding protein [Chloroflexi bacterium]|nr:ATP-binding protein [Chloroflexota bacterium]
MWLASGELQENRSLEFKRELPASKALAKQIAGLAAEGGALVIGVEETPPGNTIRPLDCSGARERVEQIARDIPVPPVHIESYILDSETPGQGVLWIEIPASPVMLHQVDGTYYERGDTQTRPMRDPDVAERIRLRAAREQPIQSDMTVALAREEPGGLQWQGRICIVARPIGAEQDEFYQSTQGRDVWESFANALCQPSGVLPTTPNRYWGILRSNVDAAGEEIRWIGQIHGFRDIEFQENGGFCHLSYCPDWLKDRQQDVFPYSAILASREALRIVHEVQERTGVRRMWDLACSVSNVKGRTARMRNPDQFFAHWHMPQIPRDSYLATNLGVSSQLMEKEPRSVIEALVGRFIAECDLDFDEELPASFYP